MSSAAQAHDRGGVPPALVTLGETMCAISPEHIGPLRHNRSVRLAVAGAETNVAIGVRRMGVPSAWIGRVGDDPMGELIARELRAEGVDVSCLRVDPGAPTGLMVKERRTASVSRVCYARAHSAGSRLCPDDVPRDLVEGARILHVTGITPALSESARAAVHHAIDIARAAGVLVSFDINYRSGLWSAADAAAEFRTLVTRSDIVFASHQEAAMVTGDLDPMGCAATLSQFGPKQVVIKLGELGYAALVDGHEYAAPAVVTTVVDPVGAGDAFVAGYLATVIQGETAEAALRVANMLGAFAVSVPGDWEGLPSSEELFLMSSPVDAVLR